MTGYTKTFWDEITPLSNENLGHLETQADVLDAQMWAVDHSADYYTPSQYAAKFFAFPGGGSGSGQNADTLSGMTKDQLLASAVPSKTVIMWHGNIASPPAGFLYCNGLAGAPDMRDLLPLGGSSNILGKTGKAYCPFTGTATVSPHTLTIQELTHHLHYWSDQYPCDTTYCNNSGTTDAQEYSVWLWSAYVGGGQAHSHDATIPTTSASTYPAVKVVHFLIKT
jgi:hypothetical protein